MIDDVYFSSSLKLDKHPISNTKQKIKNEYYYSLEYIIDKLELASEHIRSSMKIYKYFLMQKEATLDKRRSYESIVLCKAQPWRNKYKYWLICDIALILLNKVEIDKAVALIKTEVSNRQGLLLDSVVKTLDSSNSDIIKQLIPVKDLVIQYRNNADFLGIKERRVIVTANMSAGKSTLVNSLIGKDIARTSQEVCTGNICYFFNKPFEDNRVHFNSQELDYCFQDNKDKDFDWNDATAYAVAFKSDETLKRRICIIDTPGVNSAIRREHGKIAKKCIQEEPYDCLYYILNANKLGTDEEIAYLRWISNNVPREKVIFVLNKLDDFRISDDSIKSSIEGVQKDLIGLGYEKPQIFPISAYYAYLIKKKMQSMILTDDEEDEYELFVRKFEKKEYDLSVYYEETMNSIDNYVRQLKKSGFYYLEKHIYGGAL